MQTLIVFLFSAVRGSVYSNKQCKGLQDQGFGDNGVYGCQGCWPEEVGYNDPTHDNFLMCTCAPEGSSSYNPNCTAGREGACAKCCCACGGGVHASEGGCASDWIRTPCSKQNAGMCAKGVAGCYLNNTNDACPDDGECSCVPGTTDVESDVESKTETTETDWVVKVMVGLGAAIILAAFVVLGFSHFCAKNSTQLRKEAIGETTPTNEYYRAHPCFSGIPDPRVDSESLTSTVSRLSDDIRSEIAEPMTPLSEDPVPEVMTEDVRGGITMPKLSLPAEDASGEPAEDSIV